MEGFLVYCILIPILFATGFHQGVEGGKPVMNPNEDEIIIQQGEKLRIECQSDKKVIFSTQTLIETVTQSKFELSFDEHTNTYSFTRLHAISEDTGWYACAEDGVRIENDHQTIDHPSDDISWIYVYVNSSRPFTVEPEPSVLIVAFAGRKVVIPCRTTSPNIEVKLVVNDDDEAPAGTIYDSKIGFIIPYVDLTMADQQYECRIEKPNQDHDAFPAYMLLVRDSVPLPTPVIRGRQLSHVVWGRDLTLECSITVSQATFVTLGWRAPDHVQARRYSHSLRPENHNQPNKKRILTSDFTLRNVRKTDCGVYTCVATGIRKDESRRSTNISKIWDPSLTYVNATLDSNRDTISVSNEMDALWKFTVDAYPGEVKFCWIKPDGTNITDYGSDTRSKYSHSNSGTTHVFRISKSSIHDSGNYKLRFFNGNNQTETFNLPLTVTARPMTRISKNSTSYLRGKSAVFSCHVTASPLGNVSWSYVESPADSHSSNHSVPRHFLSTEEKTSRSSDFALESILNITINMTGDLTCRSCNSIGCTEVKSTISVYDEDFGIDGPSEVTEGDDFNLSCFSSRRNFTDDIIWKFDNELVPDKIRPTVNRSSTKSRSTIEIRNVSLSDAGKFSCQVESKTTAETKILDHWLDVMSAEEPRMVYTNPNTTKMTVKVNKNNRDQILICVVEGRPTPEITWYKGDGIIEENGQYHFSSGKSNLQIKLYGDEDSGKYVCRAQNRLGRIERHFDITVEGGRGKPANNVIWVSLICVLIVIIIIVITYMTIKVRKEKLLRKELLDAGLEHFRDGALECLNPDLTIDEQAELLPYDKKWEFPREHLRLGKQLGSGAFGVVMKADARGICDEGEVTTVAVKMVRRTADPSYMKALSSELKIMIHLGRHLNVVNLLGACTKTILTKRELYVIVEYCRFGNLHNYLQRQRENFIDQIDPLTDKIDIRIGLEILNKRMSVTSPTRSIKFPAVPFSPSPSTKSSSSNSEIHLVNYSSGPNFEDINMYPDGGILSNNSVQPGWRSNYRGDYKDKNLKPICTQDLLCWAWQVSRGMEYLSSRKVLHGDLAARNILLAEDNIVKICDFGLAKNMYKDANYKKQGDGPLPIKWMAIESIRDRIFSTQSDVWSFGIVLWEFFTLARSPYPGMEAEKQYDRLVEGYRMEKPEYATDEIYDFMLDCWRANPALRPSFIQLAERIGALVNERTKVHYFELSTPYMNMNAAALLNGESDYLTMLSAPDHNYCNTPNIQVEVDPVANYVSMKRVKPSDKTGVFSPRPEPEESHFSFPHVPSQTIEISSDLDESNESQRTDAQNDKRVNPVTNTQELRNTFLKNSNDNRNLNETNGSESGYSNLPNFNKSNNHQSMSEKKSDHSPMNNLYVNNDRMKSKMNRKNSKELFTTVEINDVDRNYKNIPAAQQDKSNADSIDNQTAAAAGDSYSNPSYVIMSKDKNKEKK